MADMCPMDSKKEAILDQIRELLSTGEETILKRARAILTSGAVPVDAPEYQNPPENYRLAKAVFRACLWHLADQHEPPDSMRRDDRLAHKFDCF